VGGIDASAVYAVPSTGTTLVVGVALVVNLHLVWDGADELFVGVAVSHVSRLAGGGSEHSVTVVVAFSHP
jgi:hypothetical protein